ncbi:aryl-sulfate sulfotransferase [Candidatus Thioglobus sp.]|uniref:aryl-sulfate sulfotransferase n=1 Tax=Candidatus Thioglobus sp. TaxID=2026721 RepID=UPI002610038E|nr:aryl-sulfate sulfotransferase [Candidatus Thioglobus sp.]MDG2394990.1 aryl-sulfate sulfotransferase [Candidatus Thioglobus sp.]
MQASSHCGFFDADCWSQKSLNPTMVVKSYNPDLAFNGTTLFGLNAKKNKSMSIIEVDMNGNIVWEYAVPVSIAKRSKMGLMDVKRLSSGNTLFIMQFIGIYEINPAGEVVWKHLDQATHDVDRLKNGNTIYLRGWAKKGEPQVVEVDSIGNVVWQWDALEEYDVYPFSEVGKEGWIHPNSVTRLENGHTLISLRNFDMLVEVNKAGKTVWSQKFLCEKGRTWRHRGVDGLHDDADIDGCNPHEPEVQKNGNILVTTRNPFTTYELTRDGKVVWEADHREVGFTSPRSRDVDRLPNGNTLIQVDNVLYELTGDKQIVWQLEFPEIPRFNPGKMNKKYEDESDSFWKQFKFKQLYRAQRIAPK